MNNKKNAGVLIAMGAVFLAVVLTVTTVADASRNSSGTYSPTSGIPVVSGTTISSTTFNNLISDMGSELTDSLSRSGKGGMTAPLRTADGSVAAPAHSFTSETGTGLYRIGSSDLGVAIAGTKKLELTSSLFTVTSNLKAAGAQWLLDDGTTIGSGFAGAWAGTSVAAPSSTNYSYAASGSNTNVNATSTVQLTISNAVKASVTSSGLVIGSGGTAIPVMRKTTTGYDPGATGAGGCDLGLQVSVTNFAAGDVCWAMAGTNMGATWATCAFKDAGHVIINTCAFTNTDLPLSTWTIWSIQAN